MQTHFPPAFLATDAGRLAESIVRRCVHCGFCNATCPTYQVLGDELDGPRGRIYLLKQAIETGQASVLTQQHLDRCLGCRACETTCPSGVAYGRLADIGREFVEARVGRPRLQRLVHAVLRRVLTARRVFAGLLGLGRVLRPLLPAVLRHQVPQARPAGAWPAPRHARRVILLRGCVQGAAAPQINHAAARVLDRCGISAVELAEAGCCGAVEQHLHAPAAALDRARANIDAWWPLLEQGAEAIVMSASGCGTQVRDYGHLLQADPRYAERAARVSALTRDLVEVIPEAVVREMANGDALAVAVHTPCSLQHAQRLGGRVEHLVAAAGCAVLPVRDGHLCCGSAGTYSLLQPALARRLRDDKLAALQQEDPALIVSANIGCLLHLQGGTGVPVRHWIELIDERLAR